jgi:predicted short-subunit dehydrogenase-like oxidoreductase (DUF2520 family)
MKPILSIIGAGNVAWHLAQNLEDKNYTIAEVYSRNINNATLLCQKLSSAKATDKLNFSKSKAKIFILSIADAAFEAVLEQIKLPNAAILIHTSGSQSLEVLEKAASQIAVFYPLQTFSKTKKVDFAEIPFCLEADSEQTLTSVHELAKDLSDKIYHLTSEQRSKIHVAAVFACNFSNHVLAIADDILTKNKLDFEILKPLLRETLEKALSIPPKEAQTGPAKRGDSNTIKKHLNFLENEASYQEIYQLITKSIKAFERNNISK